MVGYLALVLGLFALALVIYRSPSDFVAWDSQPLEDWAKRHAAGKFIELDGGLTRYVEAGDGENVAILLHGFFYDSNLWEANLDELARHYTRR